MKKNLRSRLALLLVLLLAFLLVGCNDQEEPEPSQSASSSAASDPVSVDDPAEAEFNYEEDEAWQIVWDLIEAEREAIEAGFGKSSFAKDETLELASKGVDDVDGRTCYVFPLQVNATELSFMGEDEGPTTYSHDTFYFDVEDGEVFIFYYDFDQNEEHYAPYEGGLVDDAIALDAGWVTLEEGIALLEDEAANTIGKYQYFLDKGWYDSYLDMASDLRVVVARRGMDSRSPEGESCVGFFVGVQGTTEEGDQAGISGAYREIFIGQKSRELYVWKEDGDGLQLYDSSLDAPINYIIMGRWYPHGGDGTEDCFNIFMDGTSGYYSNSGDDYWGEGDYTWDGETLELIRDDEVWKRLSWDGVDSFIEEGTDYYYTQTR